MPNIEIVHDDSLHSNDTSQEVDIMQYGDVYDPRGYRRVRDVGSKGALDPDMDGDVA